MRNFVPSQMVEFLDIRLPFVKAGAAHGLPADYAGAVAHLVRMIDGVPEHLLRFAPQTAADFWEAVEAARNAIANWNLGNRAHELVALVGKNGTHPLSIIRKCTAELADEAPRQEKGLDFITDQELRVSLATDLGALHDSVDRGAWKAATVLGGSLVEALLLHALSAEQNAVGTANTLKLKAAADINEWTLHQLTEVASTLGLLRSKTAAQCRIAKDFRNLIHPGRAIRLAEQCDRGSALAVAAAAELVILDLQRKAA